jgi:hypothetical protein
MSKCCPLCPRKRASDLRVLMSTRPSLVLPRPTRANSRLLRRSKDVPGAANLPAMQRRSQPRERLGRALICSAAKMDADICIQTESSARTYERPALRKAFAAFAADTKVA